MSPSHGLPALVLIGFCDDSADVCLGVCGFALGSFQLFSSEHCQLACAFSVLLLQTSSPAPRPKYRKPSSGYRPWNRRSTRGRSGSRETAGSLKNLRAAFNFLPGSSRRRAS